MFLLFPTAYAQAPEAPIKPVWNENTITALVYLKAEQEGLSPAKAKEMVSTIKCESSFKPDAVGDGGHSRGLSQIHAPSWPDVTDEQAFDPVFAVSFMAEQFKRGNERAWTCWRLLHK